MSCPAHLRHDIDPSSPFTLEVADVNSLSNVKYLAAFRVSFKVVFNHSTEEFRNMLCAAPTERLLIEVTTAKPLHILLDYIHDLERSTSNPQASYAAFKEEYYRVDNEVLYEMIYLAMRWFKIDELRPWFMKYYELLLKHNLALEQMTILLYPCLIFEQADAFAHLSMGVVFKSARKIIIRNPTPHHRHLALNPGTIRQLYSVRRQIRDHEIPKILVDKMDEICPSTCGESGTCVRMYKQALTKTKSWPSRQRGRHSIEEILQSEGIQRWQCTIPRHASATCRKILLGTHLKIAEDTAKHHWEGLCQTCMERSASNTEDAIYWRDDIQKTYGSSCDIKHGKNTWFFSNMAGVGRMNAHKASKKAGFKKTDWKKTGKKIDRKTGYNRMDRKAINLTKQSSSTPLGTTEAAAVDLLGPISSDDAKALTVPVLQAQKSSLAPHHAQILRTRNLPDNMKAEPAPATSTGRPFIPPHLRHTIPNAPEGAADNKGAVEDLITF